MDKIYSRKRFLIPKLKGKENIFISGSGWNNNKKQINKLENKKLVVFIIIVIIAVFVANKIIKTINPIMDSMCIDMAKSIETKISNEQASIVMEKYKYEDISNIVKDEQGNIKMIQMNIVTVNAITSDVAIKIQEGLENYNSEEFSIKLGTFTRFENFIR
jgi:hypothetical protein